MAIHQAQPVSYISSILHFLSCFAATLPLRWPLSNRIRRMSVKRFAYVLVLMAIAVLASRINTASAVPGEDIKLLGTWTMTQNSNDKSGQPCPFVPQTMQFFKDQSVLMTGFGEQRLPYKTILTKEERLAVEKRNPDLAGKGIVLIKPNPNMPWTSTPMVYGYTIVKNELTLTLQGWSPAKFAKKTK
jgi:hypothetical protein